MGAIPNDNHLVVLPIAVNERTEQQPPQLIISDLRGKKPGTEATSVVVLQRREAVSSIKISEQDQVIGEGREPSPKASKTGAANASRHPSSS